MGRTADRRTSRTAANLDVFGRSPVNQAGPPTDDDRLDARAFLAALTGGGDSDRRTALRAAGISDHTAPTYDPNRIVRILTALRDQLTEEIDTWTYGRISRVDAEEIWRHHLEHCGCSGRVDPCAGCVTLADALSLEQADDAGRRVWRPRPTAHGQPRPVTRRRRPVRATET